MTPEELLLKRERAIRRIVAFVETTCFLMACVSLIGSHTGERDIASNVNSWLVFILMMGTGWLANRKDIPRKVAS